MPLGVSRASVYSESKHHLPAGSTIVLYTDGVVEVRGESLDEGLERLRSLAARRHESIEELCDAVIDELVAAARPADDVALLAARLEPLGVRLAMTWPAHAHALAGLDASNFAELNARQQGMAVVVRSGSPIERMIQLTGLGETIAVHPTLPAALASLEAA